MSFKCQSRICHNILQFLGLILVSSFFCILFGDQRTALTDWNTNLRDQKVQNQIEIHLSNEKEKYICFNFFHFFKASTSEIASVRAVGYFLAYLSTFYLNNIFSKWWAKFQNLDNYALAVSTIWLAFKTK